MKSILIGLESCCCQALHSVTNGGGASSDSVHQEVVASFLLAVLEFGGFVVKMAHFFRLSLGTIGELLLQFGQIWTSGVVLLESLDGINQVFSAHEPDLQGYGVMNILIEPFCCKCHFVCGEVCVGNALSCQESSFGDKLHDLKAVVLSLPLKESQLFTNIFLKRS